MENIKSQVYKKAYKNKSKQVLNTIDLLTTITESILILISMNAILSTLIGDTVLTRLLVHIYSFNERVGMAIGGIAVIGVVAITLVIALITSMAVGNRSKKIWARLVNESNYIIYKYSIILVFGIVIGIICF